MDTGAGMRALASLSTSPAEKTRRDFEQLDANSPLCRRESAHGDSDAEGSETAASSGRKERWADMTDDRASVCDTEWEDASPVYHEASAYQIVPENASERAPAGPGALPPSFDPWAQGCWGHGAESWGWAADACHRAPQNQQPWGAQWEAVDFQYGHHHVQPVMVFGMPCEFAASHCWTPVEQAPTLLSQRRHPAKPRAEHKVPSPKSTSNSKAEAHTTVMMRNVPVSYSREMLLELLDRQGFARLYDFVYLPFDFLTQGNVGYAFINLVSEEQAARFWRAFQGFSDWAVSSRKVCSLSWSDQGQGRDANIKRYRNSPVMCRTVPDVYKPALFSDGTRVTFPAPSKTLKPPRIKPSTAAGLMQQPFNC